MPAEWLAGLPEDIRGEPSLAQINGKDWTEAGPVLAKNYVNAQKLVGTDRVQSPQASWTDKEWDSWYNKGGRPEKPDSYQVPGDLKFEEGVKLDDAKMGAAKAHFHKLGLNPRQAEGMIRYYTEALNGTTREQRTREEASVAEANNRLRAEWGDKFDENKDLAQGVIRKYGSPELVEFLNTSRLGDNPHLIKVFQQIGKLVSEDVSRGGGSGQGFFVKDTTQAKTEIDKLSGDEEFQKMLNNREHPGHKQALERWTHIFKQAYPGKQED